MGHEHGHKPQPTCVADQGDQLALWPKGHLAIGELDVAPFPEPGADPSKLPLHLVKGGGRHRVRGRPEIATLTGKVAARHRADGGPTSGVLTSEELPGSSEERRVGKECRSRWSPY